MSSQAALHAVARYWADAPALVEPLAEALGHTSMNRLERLLRIDRLLRNKRPVPMSQIVEDIGVTRSTVTRDFEYLRDFLGAPIVYDREANGHHYDPQAEAFELPGFWLNQSELYALLATQQLLESMQPGLLAPHIGPLKSRIRSLLGQSGEGAEHVGDRVRVYARAQRRHDNEAFDAVAQAVLRGEVAEIDYHARGNDRRAWRRVHPQRLLSYRENWYLVAWCERAHDLRRFSLDRIREVRQPVPPQAARRVAERDVDRNVEATFGLYSGHATAWAVLRFTAEQARWVAEEPWHREQIAQWVDGYYEVQVPYSDPTELTMEIMRYGAAVEVVAPPELRRAVVARLATALERYPEH